ncbi:MAG: archease [Deltaproteobacteria bacterium]|nr:archease [Deltaproteobacteria bacterium]
MTLNKARFTLLDHTADMGIRVTGPTLSHLFENAAQSLMQIMIKERPAANTSVLRLSVSGEDLSDLMVRWLGEIHYLLEGDNTVVMDIDIDSITETRVEATLHVVSFNPEQHEVVTEIKAVTYHQIEVARRGNSWQATVIFDL